MKSYSTDQIRNVALVGHHGSGKTSLAEAMLYVSGGRERRGSVADGTTASDYHPSEIERQMSVFTSLVHAEWKGNKINILDTPGYPDFAGEVITALKAADAAIFVMNAAEGVQVGTELAWKYADMTHTPAMFVINQLDRPDASFRDLVKQIQERFGRGATVVQIDGGLGTRSIIDVLTMKTLVHPENLHGQSEEADIDAAHSDEANDLHNALIENIAENDEGLMELYFEKGNLSEDEMRKGLAEAMIKRQLFPIFVTSAENNIGVGRLMSFINNVFPSPAAMPGARLENGGTLDPDPQGEPVAFVYRTMAEPHVGEYSFLRVYNGTLRSGQDLENAQTGVTERVGTLYAVNGRERDTMDEAAAGDLTALIKLKNTHTSNTLRAKGQQAVIEPIHFPDPRYTVSVRAAREGDEDKLAQGLHQLVEEDPSLIVTHDAHLGQVLLGGQGELHLQIAAYRLKNRFGVDVEFDAPRISYRETIQQQARAQYRHKKQTGGAGQFADISLLVEPLEGDFSPPADISVRKVDVQELPWGAKIEFIDGIVGGVIDMRRFFGAIQKGILDAVQQGPIAGYPVGDIRVVIYDGSMHSVDSNENAFKSAARMAFRDAFRQAQPVLLEPIHDVTITVPVGDVGDVMGDLNTRRGRIQGIEADGFFQSIKAQVPEAELYRYATSLRSMTQGRGLHHNVFAHYDTMPRHVQEKLVSENAAEAEA